MKIVRTKYFPFGDYSTINLFGILFTKEVELDAIALQHEAIHTAQMKEMGYIFFYIWYAIEYLLIRVFHKKQDRAYHDVSFEEEAYIYDTCPGYLYTRKHYAWIKYIKPKSY